MPFQVVNSSNVFSTSTCSHQMMAQCYLANGQSGTSSQYSLSPVIVVALPRLGLHSVLLWGMRQAVDVQGQVRWLARGWARAALPHSARDVINFLYPHFVTSYPLFHLPTAANLHSNNPAVIIYAIQQRNYVRMPTSGEVLHPALSSIELHLPSTTFFSVQLQWRIDHAGLSMFAHLPKWPQTNNDSTA